MDPLGAYDVAKFIVENQIIDHAYAEELIDFAKSFESGELLTNEMVRLGRLTQYQQSLLLAGKGEELIFGPYRLVQLLGEGGMGKVFKAWHPRLNRVVALKFVHPQYLELRSLVISRFHREARAIAQLHHPNIVLLYDADEINGIPYIAMEFVNGVSLGEMVRRNGPLNVNQACEYMRQSALALQHAFECGLVHRDIKPSNIVVAQKKINHAAHAKGLSLVTIRDRNRLSDGDCSGRTDTIKILDMGLALLNDSLKGDRWCDETALTGTGTTLGTPDFIAPEQARDARNVDIRADLYSLGCTFYFILSGQMPFPSGSAVEKLLKHQLDKPTALVVFRPNLPSSVAGIVEKLMSKKAAERFQTPQELVDALTDHLALPASDSAISSSFASTPPTLHSLPLGPSLVTARLKTVDVLAAQKNCNGEEIRDTSNPKTPAPSVNEAALIDSQDFELNVEESEFDPEPSGDPIAPSSKSADSISVTKIAGHDGVVSGVAVSADGRFAATGDVNGRIRIWDLEGFEPSEIADIGRPTEIQAVAFDPSDSGIVIFGELRKGKAALVRWDWKSNSYADWGDVSTMDQNGVGCLGFSADGEMLAAGVGPLAVTWKMDHGAATNRKIHKGQTTPIRALAVSSERLLATAGQHDSLRFWDLGKRGWNRSTTGSEAKAPVSSVAAMAFSPNGSLLAMAGVDPAIVLWDMTGSAEKSVRVLNGHTCNVLHCQFVGDGSELVSVALNGQVFFWDVQTATISHRFNLTLNLAYRVAMSEDATRLVIGFSNGTIAFCNLPPAAEYAIPESQMLAH